VIERVDAVVVGAGVVGLAVARALALAGREVIVLEQANAIGTGVSSRNSEVIHAGIYYPTGSLKARLCVAGREQCSMTTVASTAWAIRRCGKLIVATIRNASMTSWKPSPSAPRPMACRTLRLTAAEAVAMEPQLHCTAALLSPATGIVDSHGLMLALQGDLERAGGVVALGSPAGAGFAGFRRAGPRGSADGAIEIAAPRTWSMPPACTLPRPGAPHPGAGRAHIPQPSWAKGCYFTLSGPCAVLAAHLPGAAKRIRWGAPHAGPGWPGQVRPRLRVGQRGRPRRHRLHGGPGARHGLLQPTCAATGPACPTVRCAGLQRRAAQDQRPDEPAPDWRIDGPAQHGVPGLVNLLGMESPGLTSCLAIGDHVAGLLAA
jgi:hypothetical protein